MNEILVNKIVEAVLYEGYILYPYRRSTKNSQRWTFGSVFPRDYGAESHQVQLQLLLRAEESAEVLINVRFLQLVDRTITKISEDGLSQATVDHLEADGKEHQSWQEAIERKIPLTIKLSQETHREDFSFPCGSWTEKLNRRDGKCVGAIVRTQAAIQGTVEATFERKTGDILQLTVRVSNVTPLDLPQPIAREAALLHSMASTHLVVKVSGGEWFSLIDPPMAVAKLASQCKNIGVWPVLVGEPGEVDAVLASPIILYDYPRIADESPGDLFDGTEIDEILSLRIMTLSDQEKRSAADLDSRAADLLRRTDSMARKQLMGLHGTMRPAEFSSFPSVPSPDASGEGQGEGSSNPIRKLAAVHVKDAELRAGDRVILRPHGRADVFDIVLSGKTATIAAIEQDYENRIHLAVTIDDDPGADIGAAGKIGHRFYFRPEEVEPLRAASEVAP